MTDNIFLLSAFCFQDKGSAKQRRIALLTFNIVVQRCNQVAHKYIPLLVSLKISLSPITY